MLITKEMVNYSKQRQQLHRSLVAKYHERWHDSHGNSQMRGSISHDLDKQEHPLLIPYILIDWSYKLKAEGKEGLEYTDDMHEATYIHITTNKHHPEYWADEVFLNKENRDEPSETVDATKMPLNYVMYMCCDWCAVSEERGSSPFEWANKNINVRWKFTDEQIDFIYDTLERIW